MKNIHTAPVEILARKPNGTFYTEPYEAGWAVEALALVHVRETAGPNPQLVLRAQVSADGVRWLDHPAAGATVQRGEPGAYLPLFQFGNWLRLRGDVSGGPEDGSPAFVVDMYWVLKG